MKVEDAKFEEEFDAQCESIIIRFERQSQPTSLDEVEKWVREVPHAQKDALLSELARISLEKSYTELRPGSRSPFVEYFSETFSSDRWREVVAFEHYRLGCQSGRRIERDEIARLYGLSKVNWSELPISSHDQADEADGEHESNAFPKPGEVFCGYPLLAKLGRGAMARVYLARQVDLAERLVVLKVTDRLTTEADKLARIQHSNIVPVYSIHKAGELFGICMPFLGSLTVADLIKHQGNGTQGSVHKEQFISTVVSNRISTIKFPDGFTRKQKDGDSVPGRLVHRYSTHSESSYLNDADDTGGAYELLGCQELSKSLSDFVGLQSNVDTATRIIAGVVEGMAYSHEHGISHCDLKPENVLIANDGRPVILDFNLANRTSDHAPSVVGGTLPYMSPQQLRGMETSRVGLPNDDVFAIGVMFYQLLSGSLPFPIKKEITKDLNRLALERESRPIALRLICPNVSPGLQAIVQKCLSPIAEDRYPSATELRDDLQRFREHQVLRYAPDTSAWERTQKFFRRNPSFGSSTTLSVLAATLLTLLVLTSLWNAERLKKWNAIAMANELNPQTSPLLAKLHAPSRDERVLTEGVREGRQLLDRWRINSGIEKSSPLNVLTGEVSDKSRKQLGYLIYAMASAEANLAAMQPESGNVHFQESLQWNQMASVVAPALAAAVSFQKNRIERLLGNDKNNDESDVSSDSSSLLGQMLIARDKANIHEWRRLANLLVSESPFDPTSWFNLGAANFSAGKWERAMGCFDTSTKLQPASLQSVFWRGLCRMQLNELGDAYQDFTSCLQDNPNWIAARFNRALVSQRQLQLESALMDLDEVISHGEIGPRPYIVRSQIRRGLGRAEDAASDLQKALQEIPHSADDWTSLGVLQMPSDPETALRSFRQASKLEPHNMFSRQNEVHVLSELMPRTEEAIEVLDEMIRLRPDASSFYAIRGILSARLGNRGPAMEDALRASGLNPAPLEMLQIAGIYAILSPNDAETKSRSCHWLARAITTDPMLAKVASTDPDLNNIKDERRFMDIIASAESLMATPK